MSGHIRIGIVPTAAQFLLPPAARQLLKEAPEVTLRTVVGLVDTLTPLLRAGELDLMVGTETVAEDGFVSELLSEDSIVVLRKNVVRRTVAGPERCDTMGAWSAISSELQVVSSKTPSGG